MAYSVGFLIRNKGIESDGHWASWHLRDITEGSMIYLWQGCLWTGEVGQTSPMNQGTKKGTHGARTGTLHIGQPWLPRHNHYRHNRANGSCIQVTMATVPWG